MDSISICVCSNRATFYGTVFAFSDDESLVSVARFCCIGGRDLHLNLPQAFSKSLFDVRKIAEQKEGHR